MRNEPHFSQQVEATTIPQDDPKLVWGPQPKYYQARVIVTSAKGHDTTVITGAPGEMEPEAARAHILAYVKQIHPRCTAEIAELLHLTSAAYWTAFARVQNGVPWEEAYGKYRV